ncbi:hypothetical protein HDU67_000660 [Dinochytrium kinnereticum]|nr:hypothetical protein HDU67_000660 [Dinochytrium kinnereticum]
MAALSVADNLVYRSHLQPKQGLTRPPSDTDKSRARAGDGAAQKRVAHHHRQQQQQPLVGEDAQDDVSGGERWGLGGGGKEDVCVKTPQACDGSSPAYVPQPSLSQVSPPMPGMRFLHGVASGDALSDAVIIWTKVTPPTLKDSSKPHPSFSVRYDVSLSAKGFDSNLPGNPPTDLGDEPYAFSGVVVTGPEVDYTVKIDLTGLQPATTYFYRFTVNSPTSPHSVQSPTGQTRTLPSPDSDSALSSLNFAVVSCSNLPAGFFNAYSNIAARPEVDFVVHLGDYLYEYRNGEYGDGTEIGRVPVPDWELVSVEDYRMRHAQYKEDVDLQALHRVKPCQTRAEEKEAKDTFSNHSSFTSFPPFQKLLDDHEFTDNVSGGDKTAWHTPRMPSALRAYFEYLPIRESPRPTSGQASSAIYRTFQFGSLMDLILLDTRIDGRDPSSETNTTVIESDDRTILGREQERWLEGQLRESQGRGTRWRFLGNQVVFAPMDHWGLKINLDAWDGYPKNRGRVLDFLGREGIDNVVVLTGDLYNPQTGAGSLLVEFVSPSVTSPSPLESIHLGFLNPMAERLLQTAEPHLKYVDMSRRGYMIVRVDAEKVRCEYWYPRTVRKRTREEMLGAFVETGSGEGRITKSEVFLAEGRAVAAT